MSDTENNNEKRDKSDKQESSNVPRTAAEWVSLIVALLIVAALIGVIVALWAQDRGRPASFRVEKGTVRKAGSGYYLPFTVTNDGDATGANVRVEGRLANQKPGSNAPVTTFDFLPAHARADGVLVFPTDPSAADVRVVSFQPP